MLLGIDFILHGDTFEVMRFNSFNGHPTKVYQKHIHPNYNGLNVVVDGDMNHRIYIKAPPKYTARNLDLLLRVIEHELLHSVLSEIGEEPFARTLLELANAKDLDNAAYTEELHDAFHLHGGKYGYDE